ncbi:MAG: histidinol dehydrogenase, partial [Chitinispirillaceae bacterium]|nr:histidinol dehydrogenase [Chitinispirillaceae bacterium]
MKKRTAIPVVSYASSSGRNRLKELLALRQTRDELIGERVREVIADIRNRGDAALFDLTRKFDGIVLTAKTVCISRQEIDGRAALCAPELAAAIREAATRIRAYHERQ